MPTNNKVNSNFYQVAVTDANENILTILETKGGTGQIQYNTGDILYASSAASLSKLPIGSSGQILTVSAGIPSWQAPASTGVTSFRTTLNGLSPSVLTTGAITLSGTLAATSGGTGQDTYATGDIIYASAANTISKLSIGSSDQVLTVSGGVPAWAAIPASVTSFQTSLSGLTPNVSSTGAVTLAGTLGATSGGTSQSTYATGDILYASAANTLSKLTAGSTATALTMIGGIPTWSNDMNLRKYAETVVAGGSVSGTITPNANNGTIYTYTLTGSITLNSIQNVQTGTSMSIILTQGGSGSYTLSSTWKFASGSKTLSTAVGAIDIISVFYDGSTYYASLTKGYA